jgi:hypothetical protein
MHGMRTDGPSEFGLKSAKPNRPLTLVDELGSLAGR